MNKCEQTELIALFDIYQDNLGRNCSLYLVNLKPQDSVGGLDKLFLDLQKVQYIIRKHI